MVQTQLSAQELFRSAYENRYTWDPAFPGYTADVTYTHRTAAGEQVLTGQAKVGSDLKASVVGIEEETAHKVIHGQLWEVAIHRIRRSFEDTHGNNAFEYGQTLDDGTVEILMGGKAEGDRYHLKDNQVTMVHRHIHGVVVTIHTFSSHDTGCGYLSHRYDSVYHDPKTGAAKGGRSTFEDTYTQVGDYFILSERKIETESLDPDGSPDQQVFQFSNIQVLSQD